VARGRVRGRQGRGCVQAAPRGRGRGGGAASAAAARRRGACGPPRPSPGAPSSSGMSPSESLDTSSSTSSTTSWGRGGGRGRAWGGSAGGRAGVSQAALRGAGAPAFRPAPRAGLRGEGPPSRGGPHLDLGLLGDGGHFCGCGDDGGDDGVARGEEGDRSGARRPGRARAPREAGGRRAAGGGPPARPARRAPARLHDRARREAGAQAARAGRATRPAAPHGADARGARTAQRGAGVEVGVGVGPPLTVAPERKGCLRRACRPLAVAKRCGRARPAAVAAAPARRPWPGPTAPLPRAPAPDFPFVTASGLTTTSEPP
jgi:hypothetical protein